MGCGVGKLIKSRLVLFILLISLVSTLSGIAGCSLSSGQSTTPTENLQVKEQQSQSTKGSVEANKASTNPSDSETSGKLTVHFLDVGQADSALLQLPNNQTMLIDAGNNQDADFVVNYLKKAKVNKIDYLVGTHPHEDHIGGLDAVIKNFEIGKVIMPDATSTTRTFKDVLLAIKDKSLKITRATAGKTLLDQNDFSINILAPVGTQYEDLNNYSAVIKVTYGKTSFLFEGDAESYSESEMLARGMNVKADVLKVGHHGSITSTSKAFLDAVAPRYAVISTGAGNDYGHPHQKILDKLKKSGIQVYRTDKDGTLIFFSDGKKIKIAKSNQGHPDKPDHDR